MRSNLILASMLCAAAVFAQQVQEEKPAAVSGVVVNSVTGVPLPRAQVHLRQMPSNQSYGAMSGTDGRFSITTLPPGSYSLKLERNGFSMPDDAPDDIELRSGEKKEQWRLSLVPTGAITGSVTDADGEPVQGARVVAETKFGVSSDVAATTDAKGQFRIGGLMPGKYRVRAVPENLHTPPELRSDGTKDYQNAPTYYPAALTFRQGLLVDVAPGLDTSGIGIRLEHVPIVSISGKTEDVPEGAFNAQLLLRDSEGGGRSTGRIKPDGSFRLWRLYPGKYEIRADWQLPGGGDAVSAPVNIEVAGASIGDLRLRYVPSKDITGRIVYQDEAARPAPGMTRKLMLTNTGLRGEIVTADIGADGSFRVPHLAPAQYRVRLLWDNAYVAQGSLLDLTSGADGSEFVVRASSAVGTISGNTTADTDVVLVSEEAGVLPRYVSAGPGGRYLFRSVIPGKFRIIAVPATDRDYLLQRADSFRDLMETMDVNPGEKVSKELKRRSLEAQ